MDTKHRDQHGKPLYTNQLVNEASPYLTAHAHNPVDWHPWGEAALQLAKDLDKPLLISIGYRSCHWCGVQAAESFDDEAIAAIQNALFVNIKVDREERPDLDSIYMAAVQTLTGRGGWPLNVFCLPDGTPFFGGTYFPPEAKAARYHLPSWQQVLESVAETYQTRRDDVAQAGRELVAHISRSVAVSDAGAVAPLATILDSAVTTLATQHDADEGGFGGAPKFPQPMTLEFLLRAHLRGDARALPMLTLTLHKLAHGGIYDQLGGGFHRYSVDDHWLVPHFEKMLYDNALLARLYVETYQLTGDAFYRRVADETLGYLLREMAHPEGAFYSTQDADSLLYPGALHVEEGAFYVWTPDEIRTHLGEDAALFSQIYAVTRQGNFEGKNILNLPHTLAEVAHVTGVPLARLEHVAARGRERLYAVRAKRPWPFRDEKIITAWNAMALRAFAVAGMAFDEPRYVAVAQRCACFLLATLRRPDGRLLRSWKDGRHGPLGFLEDYALLIDGLVALYTADGDAAWLHEALVLADALLDLFWDDGIAGFYDTARDQAALVLRPRDQGDNATPSGNSVAAETLLRLAALTGREPYRQRAEAVLAGVAPQLARFAAGFGRMLCAADFAAAHVQALAIIGEPAAPDTIALLAVAQRSYRPHLVLAHMAPGDETGPALTPLLRERPLLDGHATAYVCESFVCKLPVTTPEALAEQLER